MFIIFLTNFTIAAYTCFSSSTLSCGDTGYYSNNILFPSFSLLSKTQLIYHSSTKNAHLATYTKQTHLISLISGLKTKLTSGNRGIHLLFLFYIEVNVGFALTDNATMCWEACLPKNSALIFSMNTIDILQTSMAATFIAAVSNILSSYEV